MTYFQPHVPEHADQRFHPGARAVFDLIGEQDQDVDIGIGIEQAAAIAAYRNQRQFIGLPGLTPDRPQRFVHQRALALQGLLRVGFCGKGGFQCRTPFG